VLSTVDSRVVKSAKKLLRALLEQENLEGTIDLCNSEEEAKTKFSDRGAWRGDVSKHLIRTGLVEIVGLARSKRPSRHSGYLALLRVRDKHKAALYIGSGE
jgi:hypothetical protein